MIADLVIIIWINNKIEFKKFALILGLVLLIHPLFMYVQIAFPELKEWMRMNMEFTDNYHWYRVQGLLNGYVPGGIFLGLSALYFCYLYIKFNYKTFGVIMLLIIPLFPFSSITGLFIYLIIIFTLLVKNLKYKSGLRNLIIAPILFILIYFVVGYINVNYPIFAEKIGLYDASKRFIALYNEDVDVSSNPVSSFQRLIDTYRLPNSTDDFIFGNIQPSKTQFSTTDTDSGLIKNIHSLGIIGSIILIFSKLSFYISVRSKFIGLFLVVWFIAFLKIDVFFSRIFFDYFYVIFVIILLNPYAKKFFDVKVAQQ